MPTAVPFLVIGGGCYGCYHTRQLLRADRRGAIALHTVRIVDRNPACQASIEFANDTRVEIVRADWLTYLIETLEHQPKNLHLVPAPFAPHLLFDWLLASLRQRLPGVTSSRLALNVVEVAASTDNPRRFDSGVAVRAENVASLGPGVVRGAFDFGLPFQHGDSTGNAFLSEAAWLCPATCIEPARCPATTGTRHWDLSQRLFAFAHEPANGLLGSAIFACRHFAYGVGTIPVEEITAARDLIVDAALGGQRGRILVATSSRCHAVAGLLELHERES